MQITIRDVAKLAGVGVATVSRVCNDSGYVRDETKQRVLQAMEQLGFNPSSIARGLKNKRTFTIGLVVPDITNAFFAEISRAVEDMAIEHGYSVILCNSDWQISRENMYLELLKQRWVDGVIVVSSHGLRKTVPAGLRDVPVVLVDQKAAPGTCSSVWVDNVGGGELATGHLLEIGCTKLIHISGPKSSASASARLKGFKNALQQSGMEGNIIDGDYKFTSGFHAGFVLLDSDNPPEGVFAANDLMALGFLQAAARLGIHVPKDVKVVGYDNIPTSALISPSLTTVDQPAYEMGQSAFESLCVSLNSNQSTGNIKDTEYSPSLIVRESTRTLQSNRKVE